MVNSMINVSVLFKNPKMMCNKMDDAISTKLKIKNNRTM